MRRSEILVLLVCAATVRAGFAEVQDANAVGFSIRHAVTVAAPRSAVYDAFVNGVGTWWNPDHTVSGNAAALYLEPRVNGCFCEVLGDGAGLVHLTVTFVNPGVMLRLTGGLGPLGLMGTAGNMTLEFEDVDGGTGVVLRYAVGGYEPDGLDTVAPDVDAVLVEQLERLKRFVEQGDPVARVVGDREGS